MTLRPWWASFGQTVATADELNSVPARAFAAAIARGTSPGVRLNEFRRNETHEAVGIEVDVERPQDLAYPIRATEALAIVFPLIDQHPRILALRADFPDTPHQNWTPEGAPCSLCIDDRPWAEAKLTSTPVDLIRRVQLWLAKAVRGDLHDAAQPLDPLFFRSPLSLIIPRSVFEVSEIEPAELVAVSRQDNPSVVLATHVLDSGEANPHGTPVILVIFPVQEGADRSVNDLRAFVTADTAGAVGVALGALFKNMSRVGTKEAYSIAIGPSQSSRAEQIRIEPAEAHLASNRDLAAAAAGRAPDRRRAVLVGAGALGSQVAIDLAREGALSWTIVDQDFLLPHNLARHALFASDTGAPKAFALARQMGPLLDEPCDAARCDVTNIPPDVGQNLLGRLAAAEIIIDASASVAVSRFLADMPGVPARRICTFFNPAGNAVVVLAESADRSVTLRDLEAQYHNLLLSDPRLAGHLKSEQPGLRYSGSCRALTSRIPATRAALLSALAANGISDCLANRNSAIRIWTATDQGEVQLIQRAGSSVTHVQLGSWSLTYDQSLIQTLKDHHARRLPNETGGVLLGIIDVSRNAIYVMHAMPQPEDSRGSTYGFERGVAELLDTITELARSSLHQIRYVGEWHSHPTGSSVSPSHIDIEQLMWLSRELAAEGVPALMAIAGDDGTYSFTLLDDKRDGSKSVRKRGP